MNELRCAADRALKTLEKMHPGCTEYGDFAVLKVALEESRKNDNRLACELLGVITDVEEGIEFDDLCLQTLKRVYNQLAVDNTTIWSSWS